MKHAKLFFVVALAVLFIGGTAMTAEAYNTYPSYNVTTAMMISPPVGAGWTPIAGWKGEAIQVYFNNGVTTFTIDPLKFQNGQYDYTIASGGDDIAIAFINQGTQVVNNVTMQGYGNGGGLFYLDNDESFGSLGITISNIHSVYNPYDTGTVNFTGGLQPGAFAWWTFESDASSLSGNFTPTPTPIPAAVWLLGTGLVGLLGIRRRFRS